MWKWRAIWMVYVLLLAKRNCDILMRQWLKSVASKNNYSKINFANHEAILLHTPKNSRFVYLGIILPRGSWSLTFLSRHLSASLIKASTEITSPPLFFWEDNVINFCDSEPKEQRDLIKQTWNNSKNYIW